MFRAGMISAAQAAILNRLVADMESLHNMQGTSPIRAQWISGGVPNFSFTGSGNIPIKVTARNSATGIYTWNQQEFDDTGSRIDSPVGTGLSGGTSFNPLYETNSAVIMTFPYLGWARRRSLSGSTGEAYEFDYTFSNAAPNNPSVTQQVISQVCIPPQQEVYLDTENYQFPALNSGSWYEIGNGGFRLNVRAGQWNLFGDFSPELDLSAKNADADYAYMEIRLSSLDPNNGTWNALAQSARMLIQIGSINNRCRWQVSPVWVIEPTIQTLWRVEGRVQYSGSPTVASDAGGSLARINSNADGYTHLAAIPSLSNLTVQERTLLLPSTYVSGSPVCAEIEDCCNTTIPPGQTCPLEKICLACPDVCMPDNLCLRVCCLATLEYTDHVLSHESNCRYSSSDGAYTLDYDGIAWSLEAADPPCDGTITTFNMQQTSCNPFGLSHSSSTLLLTIAETCQAPCVGGGGGQPGVTPPCCTEIDNFPTTIRLTITTDPPCPQIDQTITTDRVTYTSTETTFLGAPPPGYQCDCVTLIDPYTSVLSCSGGGDFQLLLQCSNIIVNAPVTLVSCVPLLMTYSGPYSLSCCSGTVTVTITE